MQRYGKTAVTGRREACFLGLYTGMIWCQQCIEEEKCRYQTVLAIVALHTVLRFSPTNGLRLRKAHRACFEAKAGSRPDRQRCYVTLPSTHWHQESHCWADANGN